MPTNKPIHKLAVIESDGSSSQRKVARSNEVGSGDSCLLKNGDLLTQSEVHTGVTFIVTDNGQPVADAERIDGLVKAGLKGKALVRRLRTEGLDLKFKRFESEDFTYNLKMIDALMPQILGALVIEACLLEEGQPMVATLIDIVSQDAVAKRYDVLRQVGQIPRERKVALTYKIKNLLMALALGMTADKAWDGIERISEDGLLGTGIKDWTQLMGVGRARFEDELVRRCYLGIEEPRGEGNGGFVDAMGRLCLRMRLQLFVLHEKG